MYYKFSLCHFDWTMKPINFHIRLIIQRTTVIHIWYYLPVLSGLIQFVGQSWSLIGVGAYIISVFVNSIKLIMDKLIILYNAIT